MCVATDSRGTEVSSVASILRVIGNQLTYKRYPVFYIVYLVSVPTPNAVAVVYSLLGTFLCITNDGVGGATITSYQWVKNGVALTNGGRVTGANEPTLSISNVMPQDQGLYQCNVTNVDGATSLSTATTLLFVGEIVLSNFRTLQCVQVFMLCVHVCVSCLQMEPMCAVVTLETKSLQKMVLLWIRKHATIDFSPLNVLEVPPVGLMPNVQYHLYSNPCKHVMLIYYWSF